MQGGELISILKFPFGLGRSGSVQGSGMSDNTEKSRKSEESGNSENTGIYRSGAPSRAAPETEFPGLESSGSFESTLLTGPDNPKNSETPKTPVFTIPEPLQEQLQRLNFLVWNLLEALKTCY